MVGAFGIHPVFDLSGFQKRHATTDLDGGGIYRHSWIIVAE